MAILSISAYLLNTAPWGACLSPEGPVGVPYTTQRGLPTAYAAACQYTVPFPKHYVDLERLGSESN